MLPNLYCASKLHRAEFWRGIATQYSGRINIVSTWHNSLTVEQDDASSNTACRLGWLANLRDLRLADGLLAFVEKVEKPNGTLTEIGAMLSRHAPVYLVGDWEWGTWRHLPIVGQYPSVEAALNQFIRDFK